MTNGHVACDRTGDLAAVIRQEMRMLLEGPNLITGDVDGDTEYFKDIMRMRMKKDGPTLEHKHTCGVASPMKRLTTCMQKLRRREGHIC